MSYQSYLLRLWQVKTGHQTTWRASLEPVGTGEQRLFSSLEALVAYLKDATQDEQTETATG